MDDDDDVFIDVVPHFDEGALQRVEGRIKDAFKDAGHVFDDAFGPGFGRSIKDQLGKIGREVGDEIGGKIGDAIGRGIGLEDVLAKLPEIGGAVKDSFDSVLSGDLHGVSDALKNLHIGGLDKLSTVLDDLGGKFDKIGELKGVVDKIGSGISSGNAADVITGATDLAADLGLKMPLPPGVSAAKDALEFVNQNPDKVNDFLNGIPGVHGFADFVGNDRNRTLNLLKGHGFRPDEPDYLHVGLGGLPDLTHAERIGEDAGAASLNMAVPALTRGMGAAGSVGALPSSITTSAATISARSAEISAVNVNINGGSINGHASASAGAGSAGSAGSMAGKPAASAARGAGVIGSVGAIPHRASGGVVPGSAPGFDNQLGLLPDGGLIGLEGGEGIVNDAAMDIPGVPDLVSRLNKGFAGGTTTKQGVGGQPVTGRGMPADFDDDDAQQGSVPGLPQGGKQGRQDRIPTGKGPGFGVTGGGLIGAAESAASMAAGMGSFGGGGAAAQVAFQEANRAAGYIGQVLPTLAVEAPLDTFWLSDSGLSDPSHSWFGKLGLSMVGEHLNSKNTAGATRAPLQSPVDRAQTSGEGGQSPLIHIEHQHNASDVDHENNNRDLVTQLGAYSGSPAPYTPSRPSAFTSSR